MVAPPGLEPGFPAWEASVLYQLDDGALVDWGDTYSLSAALSYKASALDCTTRMIGRPGGRSEARTHKAFLRQIKSLLDQPIVQYVLKY